MPVASHFTQGLEDWQEVQEVRAMLRELSDADAFVEMAMVPELRHSSCGWLDLCYLLGRSTGSAGSTSIHISQ